MFRKPTNSCKIYSVPGLCLDSLILFTLKGRFSQTKFNDKMSLGYCYQNCCSRGCLPKVTKMSFNKGATPYSYYQTRKYNSQLTIISIDHLLSLSLSTGRSCKGRSGLPSPSTPVLCYEQLHQSLPTSPARWGQYGIYKYHQQGNKLPPTKSSFNLGFLLNRSEPPSIFFFFFFYF